jgi:hypothetical protein
MLTGSDKADVQSSSVTLLLASSTLTPPADAAVCQDGCNSPAGTGQSKKDFLWRFLGRNVSCTSSCATATAV